MTQTMWQIGGVWLLAVLAGLPLYAAMGLAAFAFVLIGDMTVSIVPQKMAQVVNDASVKGASGAGGEDIHFANNAHPFSPQGVDDVGARAPLALDNPGFLKHAQCFPDRQNMNAKALRKPGFRRTLRAHAHGLPNLFENDISDLAILGFCFQRFVFHQTIE